MFWDRKNETLDRVALERLQLKRLQETVRRVAGQRAGQLLRGGADTITLFKPVVIVEQKRTMAARFGLKTLVAVDFLKSLGYKVVEEISGDYIMVMQ